MRGEALARVVAVVVVGLWCVAFEPGTLSKMVMLIFGAGVRADAQVCSYTSFRQPCLSLAFSPGLASRSAVKCP